MIGAMRGIVRATLQRKGLLKARATGRIPVASVYRNEPRVYGNEP